jgi:1-acyl-sn-glycerol-3-phosphate acyltransferase
MDSRPATEHANFLYAAVRFIGRFWVWFLFRSVDVRGAGAVPARGPVLLCINHPNNLIDSLLVSSVLTRKVHYLATAALFRNRLMARFLRACGAIPVYRKQDDPDKMDKNADAFAACTATLREGGLIGIYPEGTTHTEARVLRIRTGAARIALEWEGGRVREPREPLALIPVGLTFDARKSFGSRVRVAFGEPIAVTPYLAAYREDVVKAVDALTTAIQWAMQAQVVHVEPGDRTDLVRAIEALYRSELVRELEEERGLGARQVDPLRLTQGIADAVDYFAAHEPRRLDALRRQVARYRAMLDTYHVRDQAVRARLAPHGRRSRLRRSWLISLGLPVFVYGLIVNALVYFVPRAIARRTARKETSYATTRLLASIAAFPLFWGLEIWMVWRLAGAGWAALFAMSLPLSGILAYRYLGGVGQLASRARFGLLTLTRHQAASRLLAARREIIAGLEDAKTEYLAATKGSTF